MSHPIATPKQVKIFNKVVDLLISKQKSDNSPRAVTIIEALTNYPNTQQVFKDICRDLEELTVVEKSYVMRHGDRGRCKTCNKYTKWGARNGLGYRDYCSSKCANSNPDKINSTKRVREGISFQKKKSDTAVAIITKYKGLYEAFTRKDQENFNQIYVLLSLHLKRVWESDLVEYLERNNIDLLRKYASLPIPINKKSFVRIKTASGIWEVKFCEMCSKVTKCGVRGFTNHRSSRCAALNEETNRKKQGTWKKKYGVNHPHQSQEVRSKFLNTAFSSKTYLLGVREVKVQGFEPQALDYLVQDKGIHPDDIKVSAEGIPVIDYKFLGKSRKYFPDLYIKKKNTIIEVKSAHILLADTRTFSMNKEKIRSARRAGFKIVLLVMNTKGERVKLPKNWEELSYSELKLKLS